MTDGYCKICKRVYSNTDEGTGYYLDCWVIEKLEAEMTTKPFKNKFNQNLAGWMGENATPMEVCPAHKKEK